MPPNAKSLLLDLLSTVGRSSTPVRALVGAGTLFEIEPNAVRVALARLRAAGLVESDERSRYRLGARARAIQSQVAGWRQPEQRVRPWSGVWLAVHTAPLGRSNRPALRRRERALAFLGFRRLEPGLELRPDNLAEPPDATRRRLSALGLESDALVCRLDTLDHARDLRSRALWDPDALVSGYRGMGRRLTTSAHLLPSLPRERAMVESFLLGGEAIRQLAYDPLLPDEIVPTEERRLLVSQMLAYDRLGREIWSGVLEVDDDPARADVRGFGAVGAIATAEGV